jgi:hypothetical protein
MQSESNDVNRRRRPHPGAATLKELSRYAKCLDGRQEVANRRIEDLLREYE